MQPSMPQQVNSAGPQPKLKVLAAIPFDIIVTDNGTGNLIRYSVDHRHVNEVNEAPVLGTIGNKTINEGSIA